MADSGRSARFILLFTRYMQLLYKAFANLNPNHLQTKIIAI